jgi:hypothetical protein
MCGLAYPYDWRGFVRAKQKTSVDLLLFNPLWVTCFRMGEERKIRIACYNEKTPELRQTHA